MAKVSKTVQRACQVLKSRVRLEDAVIRLPGSGVGKSDTAAIREAMRLYVETWIVPLLDDIESGDLARLANRIRG